MILYLTNLTDTVSSSGQFISTSYSGNSCPSSSSSNVQFYYFMVLFNFFSIFVYYIISM